MAVDDVRRVLADKVPELVLQVGTQQPATYWLANGRYWLDDPYFGDVVAFDELDYDSTLGLHRGRGR